MKHVLHAGKHLGRGLFNALAELGAARMSPPREPRAAAYRLARALGTIARAHNLDVRVRGAIPRGPALIVANHVSYVDPIAILRCARRSRSPRATLPAGRSSARSRATSACCSSTAAIRLRGRSRCGGSTTCSRAARRC